MEMQTLQQELDQSQHGLATDDHPVLRGLVADQAAAYAEEVRALRQRVALLEAELAATKAASGAETPVVRAVPPRTSTDLSSPCPTNAPSSSEFTEQSAPAVVAATTLHRRQAARVCAEDAPSGSEPLEPASQLGFAQAWTAEDHVATFEERVAERAFFRADTVDEESRSWLLAH
jgi:hypothetical protein